LVQASLQAEVQARLRAISVQGRRTDTYFAPQALEAKVQKTSMATKKVENTMLSALGEQANSLPSQPLRGIIGLQVGADLPSRMPDGG